MPPTLVSASDVDSKSKSNTARINVGGYNDSSGSYYVKDGATQDDQKQQLRKFRFDSDHPRHSNPTTPQPNVETKRDVVSDHVQVKQLSTLKSLQPLKVSSRGKQRSRLSNDAVALSPVSNVTQPIKTFTSSPPNKLVTKSPPPSSASSTTPVILTSTQPTKSSRSIPSQPIQAQDRNPTSFTTDKHIIKQMKASTGAGYSSSSVSGDLRSGQSKPKLRSGGRIYEPRTFNTMSPSSTTAATTLKPSPPKPSPPGAKKDMRSISMAVQQGISDAYDEKRVVQHQRPLSGNLNSTSTRRSSKPSAIRRESGLSTARDRKPSQPNTMGGMTLLNGSGSLN